MLNGKQVLHPWKCSNVTNLPIACLTLFSRSNAIEEDP